MSLRTLDVDTAAALEARFGAPRWLVELAFESGTSRFWNGMGTLSALGHDWVGTGRLATLQPIAEAQGTVAGGISMTLAIVPTVEIPDAPDAFLDIVLTENFQGRPGTVYQAMLDPVTLALKGTPFQRFRGYLDVAEDSELPGAAVLRLTMESRMIDLEVARKRTYTPEDQKAVYPGDTFFDEVASLQNREIILK